MILNKQKKVRLATAPLRAFLRKTQRELTIPDSEITVALVTDAEIAKWNEAYRKKSGPTDVLSFPARFGASRDHSASKSGSAPAVSRSRRPRVYRAEASAKAGRTSTPAWSAPLFLGDIAVAPETAKRYAAKNGRTLGKELRILILHGVLHLMGYDHESDQGQMNRIERKLRRRLGIA